MAYKEPVQGYGNKKPQPEPDWTHILTDKSNSMYNEKVRPAAKPSKVGGYLDGGTTKDKTGM
jgi:hypothetical protein